jgi:protein-tyrosine-phosphatase
MAAALWQNLVAQHGEAAEWEIQSAGTWAESGLPATTMAQVVIGRRGIDLTTHRSRSLDADLLRQVNVILVMTRHHQEAIQVEFPEIAHKVHLLSRLLEQSFDIDDPYGGSLEDYELCASNLQEILAQGYARLTELAAASGGNTNNA